MSVVEDYVDRRLIVFVELQTCNFLADGSECRPDGLQQFIVLELLSEVTEKLVDEFGLAVTEILEEIGT